MVFGYENGFTLVDGRIASSADPQAYPESHRALVAQAIDIARRHEDEYIRHRVEVQLGDTSEGLAPLPHRVKGEEST